TCMAMVEHRGAISVVIEDYPEDGVTKANFIWPSDQPDDIYTIDASPDVSVALDAHFPLRPSLVRWHRSDTIGSDTIIRNLFGEEARDAMLDAKKVGYAALRLVLSRREKLSLAELQLSSPSTPLQIRRGIK